MSSFFDNTDEENNAKAEASAMANLSIEEAKENARSIGDYFQANMASGNALQGGMGSYPRMSAPVSLSLDAECLQRNSLPNTPLKSVVALGSEYREIGKTTLALQLAASKACNQDLVGGFWKSQAPSSSENADGDKVIYIACDDTQANVHNTLRKIATTYELDTDKISKISNNLLMFNESTTDFNLVARKDDGLLEMSGYLRDLISAYVDQDIQLIVIDTLRMATRGLSEKSDTDMVQVLAILRQLAEDMNTTVLFIHNGTTDHSLMMGCNDRICIISDATSSNKNIISSRGSRITVEGNYPFRPVVEVEPQLSVSKIVRARHKF